MGGKSSRDDEGCRGPACQFGTKGIGDHSHARGQNCKDHLPSWRRRIDLFPETYEGDTE
jgi:hypothetical protein